MNRLLLHLPSSTAARHRKPAHNLLILPFPRLPPRGDRRRLRAAASGPEICRFRLRDRAVTQCKLTGGHPTLIFRRGAWRLHADRGRIYAEPSVPTLLADFLTRAAVAPSAPAAAAASS